MDENLAWKKFQNRIQPAPVRSPRFGWMKVAASIIIVAGLGLLGFLLLNDPVQEMTVTAQQQVLMDTLPDGSVVTMNKGTLISYPSKFKGAKRQVVLKGEAFFNVEPNKEKPFIVLARGVQISVVGTSFNVKNVNGNVEVVVETGVVRVTKGETTVELRPNEKILVAAKDSAMAKQKVADQLYKYYRTKEFVCDETPLWKLVEVINEAYQAKIVIGNPALKNLSLTTTFHNESLNQVLNVISMTFNIKVIKEGDTIILQ